MPNKSVLVQNIRISALRSLKEAQELGEAGQSTRGNKIFKSTLVYFHSVKSSYEVYTTKIVTVHALHSYLLLMSDCLI